MTLTAPEGAFEAILRQLTPPARQWPTPGALAQHLDPKTVQTPALDLIDTELTRLLDQPDGRLIVSMPPQEGKALALDTPVPTPTGWTTMGALSVGDEVIGGDGKPCRVTWVSPTWTGRTCYRVTTGDGESIVADEAHEWVAKLDRRRSTRIVTTDMLAKSRSKNAQIATASDGLDLPAADLPLDPYVFGVWLGDGDSAGPVITSHPDDTEVRERFAAAGWPLRHVGRMRWSMIPAGWANRGARHPSPAKSVLRKLGVLGDKHIPTEYLRAGREQRLALLQGLIDSDGYVTPKGQVEFCATRKCLAEGVRELVYSLGGKAVMTEGRATIAGRDCGTKYRVRFFLERAAHLTRKAERCKASSVQSVRYITAEPSESVPTVCIEVDSADHTFLAGRTMLPTHNSQRCSRRFPLWALTQNPDCRIAIASYEHGVARRWGRAIRDDITTHPLGITVRDDLSAQHEWQLTGHEGGVYSVGIGAALTGRPVDLLIIDDPIKDRIQADSQTYRDRVWDWWLEVGATRLAPGAPVVLILTRWHEDDLAGRLLAADDGHLWRVINIPAEAETENDPLDRLPGEFMLSARGRTARQWEAIKVRSGARTWAALYQGHPSPPEGDLLRRDQWRRWAHLPTTADEVVQSWDLAFKDTKASDWVVGQVWARHGSDCYLLDQVRGRWGFSDTCRQIEDLSRKWPGATAKYVEDKANGPAVIDALRGRVPGLIPVNPQGGKEARAAAIQPLLEAGNVWLPAAAPWVDGLIEEAASFPNGTHDDQVDALTQALTKLMITRDRLGTSFAYDIG